MYSVLSDRTERPSPGQRQIERTSDIGGRAEGRREGGNREGGREGRREGQREGGREEGRERGREGGRRKKETVNANLYLK